MSVECNICPKSCILAEGQAGNCRIRMNIDGKLVLTTYGYPCAMHVDPVEKKPLFHFLPGTQAFSLATAGCNLHCLNCQNWEISQASPDQVKASHVPPAEVVRLAEQHQCRSIAYTYTEPVVFFEYAYDASVLARQRGIKNILVTAGYINTEPLKALCRYTDAANIDLKAYSDKFYREVCKAGLQPVLEALVTAKNAGVMVEVTNLVIPTLNDTDRDLSELCRWIKENLGPETPLHFSRFSPHYKMRNLPPTPEETLVRARKIARGFGMQYVYIGNLMTQDGENTCCPQCGKLLVERKIYAVLKNEIANGKCPQCGKEIYGIWT